MKKSAISKFALYIMLCYIDCWRVWQLAPESWQPNRLAITWVTRVDGPKGHRCLFFLAHPAPTLWNYTIDLGEIDSWNSCSHLLGFGWMEQGCHNSPRFTMFEETGNHTQEGSLRAKSAWKLMDKWHAANTYPINVAVDLTRLPPCMKVAYNLTSSRSIQNLQKCEFQVIDLMHTGTSAMFSCELWNRRSSVKRVYRLHISDPSPFQRMPSREPEELAWTGATWKPCKFKLHEISQRSKESSVSDRQ